MKHFLKKIKLTIIGAGGGAPTPPPPVVVQFPSVLAPPQMGDTNSISSFSYAEMIDLLSDGPIEGLVNRDGRKLYEENIYEGIYLNDAPIKETSSRYEQFIPIGFIKDKLKSLWAINKNYYQTLTKGQELKLIVDAQETSVFNKNFVGPIQIISYHPDDSILEFINSTTKNFDSVELLNRAFQSKPIKNEKLFLTKIIIPGIKAFLNSALFDSSEGGPNQDFPINLEISNLGNYFYFTIGSENLNSFNYFEIPRSFLRKNTQTPSGKATVIKNLISSTSSLLQYEFSNIEIFIWSIYDEEIGIKKIDFILDRYLNNIYVYQNQPSLFNYNLVQAEFKNGSEIQAPLKYFKDVQIDVEYNKELVGPFKLRNAASPGSTSDQNSAFNLGGISRVCSVEGGGDSNLSNINDETSDDIRWVKNWPVEYCCNGNPYIVRNVRFNYSIYDKTSAQRSEQKAVPVTHYISNNNVENVYVTISVNSLNDMAHIDMATAGSVQNCLLITKPEQLDNVPKGFKTYGDILNPNRYSFSQNKTKYLLVYDDGSNYNVIGGADTDSMFISRIDELTKKQKTYYDAIAEFSKFYTPNINVPTDKNLANLFSAGNVSSPCYDLTKMSNGFTLANYLIPTEYCVTQAGFKISKSQLQDINSLDSRLKTKNNDNSLFYEFGLRDRDLISSVATEATITKTCFGSFSSSICSLKITYKTASISSSSTKYIVSTKINSIIPWHEIFAKWEFNSTNYRIGFLKDEAGSTIYHPLFSTNEYPNIYKYIVYPFLVKPAVNGARESTSIQDIILVGINKDYLEKQTSFWKKLSTGNAYYLNLESLEDLLEEYSLKNINLFDNFTYGTSSFINGSEITEYSLARLLENILIKYENGKLLNISNVYGLKFTDVSVDTTDILYASNSKIFYNDANLYLKDSSLLSISQKNKIVKTSSISVSNLDYAYGESAFHADTIITYSLFTDSTNFLENKVSNQSYFQEFSSLNGKWINPVNQDQDPNLLRNATQTITAGTKLPATVKIKIETGYETEENESAAYGNYFSYCFDIFGLSTDQARIDIGRSCHPSIKSYITDLSKLVNQSVNFYKTQKIYTLELEHFSNGVLIQKSGFLKKTLVGTFFEDFCLSNVNTGTYSRLNDETLEHFGLEKNFCPFSLGGPSYANYNSISNAFSCYAKYWEPNLLLDQNHLYCNNLYYLPYTGFSDTNITTAYFDANRTNCIENPYNYYTYKIKCSTDSNCFLILKIKDFNIESFDPLNTSDTTIDNNSKGFYSNEFIIFTHGLITGNTSNDKLICFNYCPQYRAISHEMIKDYLGSNSNYSGFDYLYYKYDLNQKSYPNKFGSFLSEVTCENSNSWPITCIVNPDGGNTVVVNLKNDVSASHFSSILHLSHEYITGGSVDFSTYQSLNNKIEITNNCTALTSNAKLLTSAGFTEITSNYSNIFDDPNNQNFCFLLQEQTINSKKYCSVIEFNKADIKNKLRKYFLHNESAINNLFYDGVDLYKRNTSLQRSQVKNLFSDVNDWAAGIDKIFDKNFYDYINKNDSDSSKYYLRVFRKQIPNSSAYVNAFYIKTITELKDKRYDIVLENKQPGFPAIPVVLLPKIWIIHDKKLNVLLLIFNDWGTGSVQNGFVNPITNQSINDHIDSIKLEWFRAENPITPSSSSNYMIEYEEGYMRQIPHPENAGEFIYEFVYEKGRTYTTSIILSRSQNSFIQNKTESNFINWNSSNMWEIFVLEDLWEGQGYIPYNTEQLFPKLVRHIRYVENPSYWT